MKKLNSIGNLQIDENEGFAIFSVNPKIFTLDMVFSASYILMDKAYIFLDGDPHVEILVEIRKKEDAMENLKKIVYLFNNELLNYAVYAQQADRNKGVREAILKKILLTNEQAPNNSDQKAPEIQPIEEFDDPEEILKLWEEAENKIENQTQGDSGKKRKHAKH